MFCGCGVDGRCQYCNDTDYIGYISGSYFIKSNGPFGTNEMPCTSNTIVSSILSLLILKNIGQFVNSDF